MNTDQTRPALPEYAFEIMKALEEEDLSFRDEIAVIYMVLGLMLGRECGGDPEQFQRCVDKIVHDIRQWQITPLDDTGEAGFGFALKTDAGEKLN
ncbi:hypothetical protein NKG99_20510 [Mesorhizobium sp. M1409]|uniref:hypothetical protein n=1 Tax=Mesorhizobium sp. M1409 TaxID=2957100 RepID=UPI00333541A9